jgi:tetratricopeptide (TPR) repeat protein
MKTFVAILFLLFATLKFEVSLAQSKDDLDLAEAYYNNNEFEKAVALYDKLYSQNPNNSAIYVKYITVLESLKQYDKAEKVIKKTLKLHPDDFTFYIDLAKLYELKGDEKKASEQYDATIKNLKKDPEAIRKLASLFSQTNQIEKAKMVYEKGNNILNAPHYFDIELAAIYGKQGKPKVMMDLLLNALDIDVTRIQEVKNLMQPLLVDENLSLELQTQLYKRIQKSSNNLMMIDLLVWSYLQSHDFEQAITQMIAIDKRLKEGGQRVMQNAESAFDESYYNDAINGFKYVADLGDDYPYYFQAKSWLLKSRKAKITNTDNYTKTDLDVLKNEYLSYVSRFNPNISNQQMYANTVCDLAQLEALYYHNVDTAILILNDLTSKYINSQSINKAKIDLADYYLINGDKWESTLLYSQVDKAMPGEQLGELAKYKNAKWSYYFGDFEWAQSQMEVLKGSTSELIANDALDLSIFIVENLGKGDDSIMNSVAMQMFANADLLVFQNKKNEAFKLFDSISILFKDNNLEDDVELAKAKICVSNKDYQQAISHLDNIIIKFGEDILADDALFLKATLLETKLNNKKEAMEIYSTILSKYQGSTFVNEARKHFRALRGDKLNEN